MMDPRQRPLRPGQASWVRPEADIPPDLRRREFTLRAEIEALEGQVGQASQRRPLPNQPAPVRGGRESDNRFRHPVEVELHDRIEFATRARGNQSASVGRKRSKAAQQFRTFLWLCAIMAGLALWLLTKG